MIHSRETIAYRLPNLDCNMSRSTLEDSSQQLSEPFETNMQCANPLCGCSHTNDRSIYLGRSNHICFHFSAMICSKARQTGALNTLSIFLDRNFVFPSPYIKHQYPVLTIETKHILCSQPLMPPSTVLHSAIHPSTILPDDIVLSHITTITQSASSFSTTLPYHIYPAANYLSLKKARLTSDKN